MSGLAGIVVAVVDWGALTTTVLHGHVVAVRAWGGVVERDLAGLRAYREELAARIDSLRAGFEDIARDSRSMTATATSPDGYVTATVGPRGEVVRIDLDPRIYRRPDSTQLATTITETIHRAAEAAGAKLTAALARVVPPEELRAHLEGNISEVFARFEAAAGGSSEGADRGR